MVRGCARADETFDQTVNFREHFEDLGDLRKHVAPADFAAVKHMASNLLRRAPGKDSLRVKRRLAVCDDDVLASLVTH